MIGQPVPRLSCLLLPDNTVGLSPPSSHHLWPTICASVSQSETSGRLFHLLPQNHSPALVTALCPSEQSVGRPPSAGFPGLWVSSRPVRKGCRKWRTRVSVVVTRADSLSLYRPWQFPLLPCQATLPYLSGPTSVFF